MPIGKNSLKRVTNNGYTKVKSEAPDMEMSNIIANPDPQVMKLAVEMAEPKEEKKPTAKKQPAKKAPAKPKAAKTSAPQAKPEEKVINEKDEFAYTNLGEDLPYYLL